MWLSINIKKKTKCTLEAVVVRNNVLSQVEMHSAGGYKFEPWIVEQEN